MCRRCTAALQPQLQQPEGQDALGNTYFAPAQLASAQVFGCGLQGLEQGGDIEAAFAQLQQLQQALVQRVQTKRGAASPAPAPVSAALSLGGSLTASGPPAAQPDIDTSEVYETGAADRSRRGDADREQDEEAQRVKRAWVQLLADVESAGDEQGKQLTATSEG